MSGMLRTIRPLTQDPSVLKKTVKPGTAKRMLRFAAPYGWLLGLFLLVVIVDAGVGIINPLIYRNIALAMLVLLPLFALAARLWGRKLQQITRESYELAAEMNSVMVERFNAAGAQLAKLFGHRQEESRAFASKAGRVSDIGTIDLIHVAIALETSTENFLSFDNRQRLLARAAGLRINP
jgi:ABC-type multidrug transport system fused ATPase/permease subunit